jgi:hypothetical protein
MKNGRCRRSWAQNVCTFESLTVMLTDLKVGILPTPEMWNIFQASQVWLWYDCFSSKTSKRIIKQKKLLKRSIEPRIGRCKLNRVIIILCEYWYILCGLQCPLHSWLWLLNPEICMVLCLTYCLHKYCITKWSCFYILFLWYPVNAFVCCLAWQHGTVCLIPVKACSVLQCCFHFAYCCKLE